MLVGCRIEDAKVGFPARKAVDPADPISDLQASGERLTGEDAETEAELWRRLIACGREVTRIVVSHRPAVLRRADQVLLMDGGSVIARGTLDELLVNSAEMRRLWREEV